MKSFYVFLISFLKPIANLLFPRRILMYSMLPKGAAIVCANHSSMLDPVLISLTLGKEYWLHYMAKVELSTNKLFARILRKAGVFFVNRNGNDLGAIKTAIGLLKRGEKIGIFPEGTRVSKGDSVAAKNGATSLAKRLAVPLVPVYVSNEKKLFRRVDIAVGEPYYIEDGVDMSKATEELMNRIQSLKPHEAE